LDQNKSYKYKRVIVIDDTDVDRIIAEKFIKKYDFAQEVILMDSAITVLKYIQENKSTDDGLQLIFLDINMPDMNGWEFLEHFNQLENEIRDKYRILIVSSSPNINDKERAFSSQYVVDYIVKPISKEVILGLHAELEHKVYERTLLLKEALKKEMELGELKSRFVSFASHEFRTPLSIILSSINLLSKYTKTEEQEKRDEHINRIRSSVSALTEILNDFLSVSKLEDGKTHVQYSDVDILKLTETVITDMNSTIAADHVICYSHQGSRSIVTSVSLYRNILVNLLSNAIKFSKAGSVIEVKTSNTESECTLTVKDNGIGISEEDQKHLFERFFRGDNAVSIQGTGLGLYIVAKYVELMKGKIQYKSQLDIGTEFHILLPKHHLT
jgi:signal transduction histidine kinase